MVERVHGKKKEVSIIEVFNNKENDVYRYFSVRAWISE